MLKILERSLLALCNGPTNFLQSTRQRSIARGLIPFSFWHIYFAALSCGPFLHTVADFLRARSVLLPLAVMKKSTFQT
jgi:hypothetical protein